MVKRLEELAEFYRQNGWEDATTMLEANVAVLRRAGMPDEFSSEVADTVVSTQGNESEIRDKIRSLKIQLVQVLAPEKVEPGKRILTSHRASVINPIGSQFPDETQFTELRLNSTEFHSIDKTSKHLTTYKFDQHLVGQFNRLLNRLDRAGIKTVGALRKANPTNLYDARGLSGENVDFLKSAFRRIPTPRR